MFLNISIIVCSILYILGLYFTASGFFRSAAMSGNPMHRSYCLKRMMYGFSIKVSVVLYWFVFVQEFKNLVSVLALAPELLIMLTVLVWAIHGIVQDLYLEKMSKKEKNQ